MKKNTPLISVVIPAYNEEKTIGNCLKALNKQTLSRDSYEVIIVNNKSSDKTGEIAQKMGAKVLNYTRKQSPVYARQYGSEHARSPILVFSDADTIPATNWLENILQLFQDPDVVCVGGTVLPSSKSTWILFAFRFFDQLASLLQQLKIPLVWGPNMAVRKQAFEKVNGFKTTMKTGDDWDFVVRLQKRYGRSSVYYTTRLQVTTSPRKHEKLNTFIPYLAIGTVNFVSIHVLRKSKSVGDHVIIR